MVPEPVTARGITGRRAAWTFTPLTLRLVLAGLVLVIPLWLDRRLIVALLGWDAVVLAGWLIDLRRLPRPEALSVTRSWTSPAALSVPQTVHLKITNDSSTDVRLWITDSESPAFQPDPPELALVVPARGSVRAQYDVRPMMRGDAPLRVAALRYRTATGLAERWAIAPLSQTIRVYPDIREAQRQTLALIRARQIAVEKRRARSFGLGRDFESLREFQQGDEPRDVCWTATARRGRLVARTYQPERSQTVWIVVDTGRLMRAREGIHTRLDRAANAAFALAQVAGQAGDRVGLMTYGRGTQQRLAPGRGAPHLRAMLEALATARPEMAEADHVRAAGAVMAAQKRRALIVWLTDVAETAAVPEVIESASRMVPHHVVLFAVTRPVELAAVAEHVPSDARDLYRVMAAQEVVERRAQLLRGLRQRGALAVEVPSAELTATVVDRYLDVKERNLL